MRSIGSFGIALILMLTAGTAGAQKVNWSDYVERGPTKYTEAAKNANTQPAKAKPVERTAQPKTTRAVAKAPPKAAPKAKAKAPVRKK